VRLSNVLMMSGRRIAEPEWGDAVEVVRITVLVEI
jgi:hypothetical protein